MGLNLTFSNREKWAAACPAVAAFFVLCGYEFARSSSYVLFKSAYGAQNLAVVMAIMPLAVVALLYIYGHLLSWIGPRQTLFWTTLGSGGMFCLLYGAIQSGWAPATGLLYLFRDAYIVLLVEQYWSFINSTLGQAGARKLNGPIAGLSSIGAICGGLLVGQLAEPLGTASMILFSAGLLIPAAFISDFGYKKCGEPTPAADEKGGKQGHMGLHLFKDSPMLTLLLLIVITTQIISTAMGLSFQTILSEAIPQMDQQTAFQGNFFATLNGASAFLQFIAAPLLMSLLPLSLIYLGLPLIHVIAIGVSIFYPSLSTVALAYLLFKAFDYSIFRATKEILYIPLSFDARFRAKEIIDVFGYRFSKGGSSFVVVMLQNAGIAMSGLYSWISIGAAGLWVCLILPIIKHLPKSYKKSI